MPPSLNSIPHPYLLPPSLDPPHAPPAPRVVRAGATPVTIFGSGFRNFVPELGVQRCSWGYGPDGTRHTTAARYDAALGAMVCLSYLRGADGLPSGAIDFSLSLNGVDFIAESEVALVYKFYDQPTAFIGVQVCRRLPSRLPSYGLALPPPSLAASPSLPSAQPLRSLPHPSPPPPPRSRRAAPSTAAPS